MKIFYSLKELSYRNPVSFNSLSLQKHCKKKMKSFEKSYHKEDDKSTDFIKLIKKTLLLLLFPTCLSGTATN